MLLDCNDSIKKQTNGEMRNQEIGTEVVCQPFNHLYSLPSQECTSKSPESNYGMTMYSLHRKKHCQNKSHGERSENVKTLLPPRCRFWTLRSTNSCTSGGSWNELAHPSPCTTELIFRCSNVWCMMYSPELDHKKESRISRYAVVLAVQLLQYLTKCCESHTENQVCTRPHVLFKRLPGSIVVYPCHPEIRVGLLLNIYTHSQLRNPESKQ